MEVGDNFQSNPIDTTSRARAIQSQDHCQPWLHSMRPEAEEKFRVHTACMQSTNRVVLKDVAGDGSSRCGIVLPVAGDILSVW